MSYDNFMLPSFDMKSDPNNLSEKWKKWLRSFEYLTVGRAITDDTQKAALLLHLAGSDVQDLYETLPADPKETGKSETEIVKLRLSTFFTPLVDKTFERHLFRKISQGQDTCDQFLTRQRQSASKCKFADEEDQLRGQFIDGCRDRGLRRRILERGEITLVETMKIARAFEVSQLQEKMYESVIDEEVKAIYKTKPSNSNWSSKKGGNSIRCFRCNQTGHKSSDTKCPAKDKTCRKCGRVGHFAIVCKTQNKATEPSPVSST